MTENDESLRVVVDRYSRNPPAPAESEIKAGHNGAAPIVNQIRPTSPPPPKKREK